MDDDRGAEGVPQLVEGIDQGGLQVAPLPELGRAEMRDCGPVKPIEHG